MDRSSEAHVNHHSMYSILPTARMTRSHLEVPSPNRRHQNGNPAPSNPSSSLELSPARRGGRCRTRNSFVIVRAKIIEEIFNLDSDMMIPGAENKTGNVVVDVDWADIRGRRHFPTISMHNASQDRVNWKSFGRKRASSFSDQLEIAHKFGGGEQIKHGCLALWPWIQFSDNISIAIYFIILLAHHD